ncbi:sporulation integral membrane protein YtvI [Aeribacillus pallidus]|nr:sporulation integral membrane protein YtvI [Aeribacillus pallidus]
MKMKKYLPLIIIGIAILILIPFSIPILLALLTALVLEKPISILQNRFKIKRPYAVLLIFVVFLLLLCILGFGLINFIYTNFVSFIENIPLYVRKFNHDFINPLLDTWENYSASLPEGVMTSIEISINNSVNAVDGLVKQLMESLILFVSSIPGFFIEALIYLIALYLISLDLPKIWASLETMLTEKTRNKIKYVVNDLYKAGFGFIKAQVILSLLTFILAYIGLVLLRVDYSLILAIIIVVVDILPILGTGSVLVPWAIYAFSQGQTNLGIGLVVLFLVITVVRRAVEPKIMSTNMGISPLAALISMFIGLKMLGILGLFLGPVVVILFETLRRANIIKLNIKI